MNFERNKKLDYWMGFLIAAVVITNFIPSVFEPISKISIKTISDEQVHPINQMNNMGNTILKAVG